MRVSKISWWAAVLCLVLTTAIWLGFLLMRINPGENPTGPIVARVLLVCLILSVALPVGAVAFSSLALVRPPRPVAHWLVFGLSWLILFCVTSLFLLTRMM